MVNTAHKVDNKDIIIIIIIIIITDQFILLYLGLPTD